MSKAVLYEIVGMGWRLPVLVEDYNGNQLIQFIDRFPYLTKQRAAIGALLKPFIISIEQTPNDICFVISILDLGQVAEKSAFTDPEDVVVWRKPEPPPADPDFIEAYVKWDRAIIGNPEAAALLWDSFCRFMEHWLLNRVGPVNLGFAKLHAFCFRNTWMIAANNKFIGRRKNATGRNPQSANTEAARKELCDILQHEDMLAWDERQKCFRWILCVEAGKEFESSSIALEQMRRGQREGRGYFLGALEQLKRQLPYAYEIFRAWNKEARHPIAPIGAGITHGPEGLFKYSSERYRTGPKGTGRYARKQKTRFALKKTPVELKPAPDIFGSPVVLGRSLDMGTAHTVVHENAAVLSLPDLQQRCPDVRDCGENVDQPNDQPD